MNRVALVLVALTATVAVAVLPRQVRAEDAGTSATPRALTLAEAVAMAERNAVGVVRAAGDSRTASAASHAAIGAFFPSLSVTAGASKQLGSTGPTRVENGQVVIVTPQPWSSSLGIGASVSLFDGGQRLFDLTQAKAGRVAAAAGAITARWEAALAAKQAFFDVLAAREIGVAAAAQLEQAEQQRVTAIARTQAKAATRSDSLRAEIQVRSARLAVLQAGTSRASADAALARAVGSLEPVTAASGDTLDASGLALDESQLVGLVEDAPAVRAAKADLDAARAVKNGTWPLYLPSVTASWGRNGTGAGTAPAWTGDALEYSGAFRLGLTFPLFDQFQREQRVTQADVSVKNAEAALRDARLAARQSLTDGLGGYREAAERVASTDASVLAADEDLRVQQQRYEGGGSTLLDVLASQTQLDQARRDLIRARYDQRVAKAQLEALVGRDL